MNLHMNTPSASLNTNTTSGSKLILGEGFENQNLGDGFVNTN